MAAVKFFKVLVLPTTLQPNSVYFVENGSYAESFVTDSFGVAKAMGNTAMITAIAGNNVVSYTHTQNSPSNTWTIVHNLGFKPNLRIIDSSGTEYVGSITDQNNNQLTVVFSAAFAGTAYLS